MFVSFASLEAAQLSPDRAAAYASQALHEVSIAIGHATIAVRFSRASAAAAFAERFGDMLGTGAPVLVVYAVDLPGEAYFWLSPGRARCWPHALNDEVLVFFADNVVMHEYLTNSADLGIHAAVVANGSAVAAIVGISTAGKSTTAIAAARNGLTLYSDERCIIQDGLVVPFLRAITVREGGRAALLSDPVTDSPIDARLREFSAQGDTPVRPHVLLGAPSVAAPRPLGAIFIIEGRDDVPSVEPCTIYPVMMPLLHSVVVRETGLERAARIVGDLRRVPMYRLRLGSPGATATAIERTLDEAVGGAAR